MIKYTFMTEFTEDISLLTRHLILERKDCEHLNWTQQIINLESRTWCRRTIKWKIEMRNIQDISQIVKVKNKNRFLRSFLTNILTSEVETVTPEVRSSLSDDTWGLLRGVKESYQCIPAVCIVSPSERWTWTSSDRTQVNVYLSPFLSSREFALRPGRKPPRLASPLPRSASSLLFAVTSAVEQQAGYSADKVRAASAETAKNTRRRCRYN